MLLVIHNLPANTRYTDVKTLIKDKCGFTEIIIDNLVAEGNTKKVTVGLTGEGDAAILVRKINGLYVNNHQLYVEDIRQKKNIDQPYQSSSKPCEQQELMQFQPPAPNFGVPFYMTAQNKNVGNNLQLVEYPKVQMSMGNPPDEGREMGFSQRYGRRPKDRSMSPDRNRGPRREKSPRRLSNRNESDRSDNRRNRDRFTHRDDCQDSRHSYKKKPYQDSYQSNSNHGHRSNKQNNDQFEKKIGWSERNSKRSDRPSDCEKNESYRFNDTRNFDTQDRRYNRYSQEREPQTFRGNNDYKSRGSDNATRPGEFSIKRPYESFDKNEFSPPNKKFGNNQDFNSRNEQETFDGPFSDNLQNNNRPHHHSQGHAHMQTTGPHLQSTGPYAQPTRPHMQPIRPNLQPTMPHMQPARPHMQPARTHMQPARPHMQPTRAHVQPPRAYVQPNRPHVQPTRPFVQPTRPHVQPTRPFVQPTRPHVQPPRAHEKPKGPYVKSNKTQMYPKGTQMKQPKRQLQNQPMKHSKQQGKIIKNLPGIETKNSTKEMLARHEAWRVQASAVIATQILNAVGAMHNKRDPLVNILKGSVRTRIDFVTGDDMSVTLKDMLSKYRETFPDDSAFYYMVLEKAEKGELKDFETAKKVNESDKNPSNIKPKVQFIGKPPAKAPTPGNNEKLPKYPDGNKKVLFQLKQAQKEEMINESLYNLDAEHEKALKEEMDTFEKLIKAQLANPQSEAQKSLAKFMNERFLPDLLKILTLHAKKRILDVRTNLSVRVLCHYKPPKRNLLDAFLKDYGVVSLKASERKGNVMIAICDSYENYDALCKLGSTVFDDLKVSFKPLHITGPPIRGKFKKQALNAARRVATEITNKNIATADENSRCDAESKGQIKEIHSKDNTESDVKEIKTDEETNKNEDVILVENNASTSIDVNIDKNGDNVNNIEVIELDEESADTDSVKIIDDNEIASNDKQPTVDEAPIGDNTATVDNDSKIIQQEESEIMDNDHIAEDDLEDF